MALAVAAVALAAQWPFRLLSVNVIDEGLVMQLGADLLAGKHLYADAVVFAWPGTFYLAAAAFWLWAVSVEVARALVAGSFAVTVALAFLIGRWFAGVRGALLAAALFLAYRIWAYPHWQMLNYSSLAMTLVLGAVWTAGMACVRGAPAWAAAAGITVALATLCKQDSGGLAAILLAMALVAGVPRGTRRTALVAFAVGAALPIALWGLSLLLGGRLEVTIRESVLSPLYGAREFSGYLERPSLWPLVTQDAWLRKNLFSYAPPVLVDLFWLPLITSPLYRATPVVDVALKLAYWGPWFLVGGAVLLVALRRRHGALDLDVRRIVLLAAATTAAQLAFNPPRDWVHLVVLYPPALLLALGLAATVLPRAGWVRAVARATALVLVVAALGLSGFLAVRLRALYDTPLRTARGTLYGIRGQVEPLQQLVDDLAARPPAPVQALPYHTLVNFLVDRPAVSRYYIVWPIDPNTERDAEVIAGFEKAPAADVVYSPMQVPHYPRPVQYAPSLFGYLADHYETERVYGGELGSFTFLRAVRREPPPGRPLAAVAVGPRSVRFVEHPERTQFAESWTGEVEAKDEPWPFKRTLVVGIDPSGWTEVSYELDVGAGQRFETSLGLSPDDLGRPYMPAVEFVILVDDGTASQVVVQRTLDPYRDPAARGWVPVAVDLSPWAGRRITLRLRTGKRAGLPGYRDVAGWGDPRIVGPSETAEAEVEQRPGAGEHVARAELR